METKTQTAAPTLTRFSAATLDMARDWLNTNRDEWTVADLAEAAQDILDCERNEAARARMLERA